MLLLCDLDDTILDREGAFAAWARGFVEARHLPPDALEWLIGHDEHGYRPRPEFFTEVRRRFGLADPVALLQAEFYDVFPGLCRSAPGVEDALVAVRAAGWRVAVVTNGSPAQEGKIVATGLDRLVDTWCISAVEGVRKPDRRLLEIAAERCHETLDGAWLIGDAPHADIGAAHSAGLASVWMTRGRTWPRDDYAPTFQADTFPEAVGHLP